MTSPAFDLIGLTQLRNDPRYRGIDGKIDNREIDGKTDNEQKNLAVVVIDTGIQGDHPLLGDNLKAYVNFTENTDATKSSDGIGHGTHVAGTIGSEDESIGVATGVDLISLQVFSRNGSADNQDIVKALQWVLDNQDQYNIVAVNMSLGQDFYTSSDRSDSDYIGIINKLEQAGITVVSAAGNNYAEQQNVMSPAIFSTLAVGAVYQDYYTFDFSGNFSNSVGQDEITEFSQRLQFDSMIFAPGAYINSTVPGDGKKSLPGTSMASPMVAGAVALLQEAALKFGDRKLTPDEVREILLQTADEIIDGDTENNNSKGQTFLRMNVYKAVQEVERRLSNDTPGTNPDPDPNPDQNPTDSNGIISRAISLESDNNIVLEQLTELTTVASDAIGTDEGTIEFGGTDVDLFRFNVTDTGVVTIQTTANDVNPVDTILRLFDASGNEISIDDDSGDEQFSKIEAILEAGQYFAGVSGYNNINYNPTVANSGSPGETGSYSLQFQFQSGTIELTPETTTQLYGSIGINDGDVDLFKFVAPETGSLLIGTDTTSYNNSADTYLRLLDANRNEIDDNDSFLSASVTAKQTYFIGVSGYGNDSDKINNLDNRSAEDTGGSYNLYVTYITSDDENGTIKKATQFDLDMGNPINGNIGSDNDSSTNVGANDVDFYKINSAQGGLLDININAFEGTDFTNPVDSMVFLFDEQGNELAFNDDSPFSLDSELQYLIDAKKDYYLAVSGYRNFNFDPKIAGSGFEGSTGDYTLNARVLQPQDNPGIYAKAFKNALDSEVGERTNLSLDVDREIFGPNLDQIHTDDLVYLKPGTSVTASLGEDIIGSANSSNSSREFSTLHTLYRTEISSGISSGNAGSPGGGGHSNAASHVKSQIGSTNLTFGPQLTTKASLQIFGDSLNGSFNSGADDVDYYLIRIDLPGRYDLQTLGTGLGTGGANTTLRLYDYERNPILNNEKDDQGNPISNNENTVSLPGTDSRVLVSIDKPGDYWIAVLPEAEAAERFDFKSHSFGTEPLTEEEKQQLSQSTGEYGLLANRFTLKNISTPVLRDGAISVEFNDVLNQDRLSLYDGSDAETFDLSSLTVVDSNGNPVRGSLVVENNKVIFVPTNPLDAGTYNLTYNSNDFITQFGSENTQFESQEMLDGDRGGSGGDNLITNISVTDSNDVLLTVPSFARGPGQAVDIGGAGAGLPISVSNAKDFIDIRLRLKYNPELLNITDVVLADGLPGDWQRTGLDISDGQVLVDLAGTTALEAGRTNLVKLVANVPEDAAFSNSQVLRVSGGAIDENRNPIALEESAAVHKVAFLGDANGDGIIDFGDVLAIENLVSSDDISGFDRFDLTDPVVIGDVNRDNIIDSGDVSAVAREFLDDSALIPSTDNTLIPEAPIGADSEVTISTATAQPGETVSVTVSLTNTSDATDGVAAFNLAIRYPSDRLNIAASDIQLSQELTNLGFETLGGITVDEQAGLIKFGSLSLNGNSIPQGATPTLATLNFSVPQGATSGEVNIELSDDPSETGVFDLSSTRLGLTAVDGSITIGGGDNTNTPPTITANNGIFALNQGEPINIKFTLVNNETENVNEVGVFVVDDESGNVDGNAPGSEGYLKAALQKAQVIFSAIANRPNGFDLGDIERILEVDSDTGLGFYLISNGTTDTALAQLEETGTTNLPVFFSDSSNLQISELGSDGFNLNWSDEAGGSNFKNMELSVELTQDSPAPFTKLQAETQKELIDLSDVAGEVSVSIEVHREAAFDNLIGFYQVVDSNGGIDINSDGVADINPGDSGYKEAALTNRITGLDLLETDNNTTTTVNGNMMGGSILATFMVVDGTVEQALEDSVQTYFSYIGANNDGVDHIRLLGDNTFGYEDMVNGGDNDFNDMIVGVNFPII